MNADFDLENILNETKTTEAPIKKVKVKGILEKKDRTKNSILIDIINGVADEQAVQKNVTIRGMLTGITELPVAPEDKRKVIIFSKFDESLDEMGEKLKAAGIEFKRLGGTEAQLHRVACEFHDSYDGVNVLLINGAKYSSGRNLQSATDLVFMHKILDRNIEAQIIGRIQRLGRVYGALIHYILYDDEVPYMNFN
jgi:SNF2 family DNA or RNA helicase